MPTTPQQPPKPSTPPSPSPPPKPEAAKASSTPPIGALPADPKDPQAIKFEQHAVPPRWEEPPKTVDKSPDWTPKAAIDPRAEKPPEGAFADGMGVAQEQRLRSAWIEEHGLKAYDEATDQRPDDEKPKFDKDALAGGGAFVSPSTMKQVPGVTPPTKRE